MDENKKMKQKDVDLLAKEFVETIDKVEIIFGNSGSFRRWLPESAKWKQQISAPLYDSQMFACYNKDKQKIIDSKDAILYDYKNLFSDDNDFIESIESSTAAPNRFLYRTNKLNEIIRENT